LATAGSDGRFSFWDKDSRTKLKTSEQLEQSITACCFNRDGQIFAYAVSYDWSKGHEFNNPQKKNYIFLHSCYDEMKPRQKSWFNCFMSLPAFLVLYFTWIHKNSTINKNCRTNRQWLVLVIHLDSFRFCFLSQFITILDLINLMVSKYLPYLAMWLQQHVLKQFFIYFILWFYRLLFLRVFWSTFLQTGLASKTFRLVFVKAWSTLVVLKILCNVFNLYSYSQWLSSRTFTYSTCLR
jgi:hypothetical protein